MKDSFTHRCTFVNGDFKSKMFFPDMKGTRTRKLSFGMESKKDGTRSVKDSFTHWCTFMNSDLKSQERYFFEQKTPDHIIIILTWVRTLLRTSCEHFRGESWNLSKSLSHTQYLFQNRDCLHQSFVSCGVPPNITARPMLAKKLKERPNVRKRVSNTHVVSVLSQCCIFTVWYRSWRHLICYGVQF